MLGGIDEQQGVEEEGESSSSSGAAAEASEPAAGASDSKGDDDDDEGDMSLAALQRRRDEDEKRALMGDNSSSGAATTGVGAATDSSGWRLSTDEIIVRLPPRSPPLASAAAAGASAAVTTTSGGRDVRFLTPSGYILRSTPLPGTGTDAPPSLPAAGAGGGAARARAGTAGAGAAAGNAPAAPAGLPRDSPPGPSGMLPLSVDPSGDLFFRFARGLLLDMGIAKPPATEAQEHARFKRGGGGWARGHIGAYDGSWWRRTPGEATVVNMLQTASAAGLSGSDVNLALFPILRDGGVIAGYYDLCDDCFPESRVGARNNKIQTSHQLRIARGDMQNVQKFLNRIATFPLAWSRALSNYFMELYAAIHREYAEAGKLDTGILAVRQTEGMPHSLVELLTHDVSTLQLSDSESDGSEEGGNENANVPASSSSSSSSTGLVSRGGSLRRTNSSSSSRGVRGGSRGRGSSNGVAADMPARPPSSSSFSSSSAATIDPLSGDGSAAAGAAADVAGAHTPAYELIFNRREKLEDIAFNPYPPQADGPAAASSSSSSASSSAVFAGSSAS